MRSQKNFLGIRIGQDIRCDNKYCGQEIHKHDRYSDNCFAYKVKTRILFHREPTRLTKYVFSMDCVFWVDNRGFAGYHLDKSVQPLRVEFCCGECADVWAETHPEYNIILRRKDSNTINEIITEEASKFVSFRAGSFPDLRAPGNFTGHIPKILRLGRCDFPIKTSNFVMGDGVKPRIGAVMSTVTFRCPMPKARFF